MNLKNSITMAAVAAATMAQAMKPNDTIHNFTVKSSIELPEVPGRLWRMTYEKNGAELVWLEREDENKTFAVAFKTVPENETGVAHIMEHSVLCGSKKYPVKEPFVDLLKSFSDTAKKSQTFLIYCLNQHLAQVIVFFLYKYHRCFVPYNTNLS